MTGWIYFEQVYSETVSILFRSRDGCDEIYHRADGWMQTDELMIRRAKGEIDDTDIITEAEAEALVKSFQRAREAKEVRIAIEE